MRLEALALSFILAGCASCCPPRPSPTTAGRPAASASAHTRIGTKDVEYTVQWLALGRRGDFLLQLEEDLAKTLAHPMAGYQHQVWLAGASLNTSAVPVAVKFVQLDDGTGAAVEVLCRGTGTLRLDAVPSRPARWPVEAQALGRASGTVEVTVECAGLRFDVHGPFDAAVSTSSL